MRIGLGTVQFGLNYGISNTGGQTSSDEVRHILTLAAERGVRVLDTAALYGNSESVLGAALPAGIDFRIVTKTPRMLSAGVTSGVRSVPASMRTSSSSVFIP
jgi:aryl-alcohol dehydrogenase-like predicted oxidoreductase